MEIDRRLLKQRTFNYASFSTDPEQWENLIRMRYPDFKKVIYVPDFRQAIANSWPAEFDCSSIQEVLGQGNSYGLEETVNRLLEDVKMMIN